MADDALVLIVENGSGFIKAGFAGGDTMRSLFPNVVGKPKINGTTKKDFYIGHDAMRERDLLSVKHPIERGIVTNWDHMEQIWHYTFYEELRVAPEEHPVLFTDSPSADKKQRETMARIMFETFNVPAMYCAVPAALSWYCRARGDVGLVVDIGYGVTHTVPIYFNHALQHSIQTLPLGGQDITDYLQKLLAEQGHQFSGKELDEVKEMKHKLGYVALDYDREVDTANSSSVLEKSYELPDGKSITLSSERFNITETLFRPSLLGTEHCGLGELMYNSIMKSDMEIRGDLYANVLLCGNSAMFPGMAQRLERELAMLAPSGTKIKVGHPQMYSTYIGGSILGSMSTFRQMCIPKEEYDEVGAAVVHRMCF